MTKTSEKFSEEVVMDLNDKATCDGGIEPKEDSVQDSPKVIPAKRIDELTDSDKQILINNARAGIENPYFDVKLFKNGSTRICKKKKPTISNQAVTSNGIRTVKNQTSEQKVYMTDNQLIWEHLLELESKYNNLYRKHKKLKSKYNDLYIEDDIPANNMAAEDRRTNAVQEQIREEAFNSEPVHEEPVRVSHEPRMTQSEEEYTPEPVKQYLPLRAGWRASLQNRNFYIN